MINDFKEYQESLARLSELLQELSAHKVSSQKVNSMEGADALRSLILSHESILNMIRVFMEDPAIKGIYTESMVLLND